MFTKDDDFKKYRTHLGKYSLKFEQWLSRGLNEYKIVYTDDETGIEGWKLCQCYHEYCHLLRELGLKEEVDEMATMLLLRHDEKLQKN